MDFGGHHYYFLTSLSMQKFYFSCEKKSHLSLFHENRHFALKFLASWMVVCFVFCGGPTKKRLLPNMRRDLLWQIRNVFSRCHRQ